MLGNLLEPLAVLFGAAMMFSASLAVGDREIRRVLDDRMLLVRAVLANVVIVPVLAIALTQIFHVQRDIAVGTMLTAISPGAPFGTFLSGRSRQDVALAVVLTCGLTVIALVTVPVTSWLIFGPGGAVALPRGFGIVLITLVILLPVALGRAIRQKAPALANRIAKGSELVTILAFVAATLAAAGLRSRGLRLVGWRGTALILTIVVLSIGTGWLFGTTSDKRATLSTSTGLRNASLAYLFAQFSFPATQVLLGVAAYSVLMLLPNFLFATAMRYRREKAGVRLDG